MPTTLLKRCTCPHCWKTFVPEEVLWVASHPEFSGRDPRTGEFSRFLPSRFNLQGEALDAKGQLCAELACPACHLPIPRSMVEVEPFFVSIVGSPSCGKSVFLAAMTWEMRKFLPYHFRVSFLDADARCNRILNEYQEKLFANPDERDRIYVKELIRKTEQTGETYNVVNYDGRRSRYPKPFFFSLAALSGHPYEAKADRFARVISLYDNAGENYLTTNVSAEDATATQHLGKAQFLMFLFDPLQDIRFEKRIAGSQPDGGSRRSAPMMRQETIFIEAIDRIRRLNGIGSTAKYDRPVILVVTKSDAWQQLLPPPPENATPWTKNRDGVFFMNPRWVREQSQQIRELLIKTTPEVVTTLESFASNLCYVGVSSLGTTPEPLQPGDRGFDPAEPGRLGIRPVNIKPRNVVLPFIHGLSETLKGPIPRTQQ